MEIKIKTLAWIGGSAIVVGCVVGAVGKGQVESILKGANFGGTNKEDITGDKTGGDKTGGDKVGGDKIGGNQSKNTAGRDIVKGNDVGIGSIQGSNVTITIQPGDPKYRNESQPNLLSSSLAEVKPVELSMFKGANPFSNDLILQGYGDYARFDGGKIAILDKQYKSIFELYGDTTERKTMFSLSGDQKGIYLQFGLKDLTRQGDNLMYDISIYLSSEIDTKKVWSGKVIYGSKNQQIVSLPFDAAGAKNIVIKYTIIQGNDNRPLFFTRAELLYD
jgi:hypothetical protein